MITNFSLDISPLALLTGTGKLESLKLNGLRANVIQNGEHFNFSDILDFLNKQNQDSLSIAQKEKTNVIENQKPIADSLKTAKDSIQKFQANFVNPLKSLPIKVQLENIDIKNSHKSLLVHFKQRIHIIYTCCMYNACKLIGLFFYAFIYFTTFFSF